MSARFRPVWLVLDPFTGGRVPLGALVESGGFVEFVAAPEDLRRRLTAKQETLVRVVLQELEETKAFDELPVGVGPQVIAGDASAVPATVRAPARWVAERVLGYAVAA